MRISVFLGKLRRKAALYVIHDKFVPVFPRSGPIENTEEEEALETEPLTEAVQDSYHNEHAVVPTQPDVLTAIEVPDDEPMGYSAYILPPDKCADQIVSDGVPRSTSEDMVERDYDTTSTGIAATNLEGREFTQASTNSNIRGCMSSLQQVLSQCAGRYCNNKDACE